MDTTYFDSVTKLGVIADIQYCDANDGFNFDGTEFRRYRESLNVAKGAARSFQKHEVAAVIQLGDAIDMKSKDTYCRDFNEVLCPILSIPPPKNLHISSALLPKSIPRLDVMGNHELYCATREQLKLMLNDYNHQMDLLCYSKEIAHGKWRLITLDSFAVSVLGFSQSQILSPEREKQYAYAKDILRQNNPTALDDYQHRAKPLDGKERFEAYNGGIGKAQLQWLERELKDAWDKKQFVVIFSHIPISGFKRSVQSLHWDADDLLKLIQDNGSHIVACFGGHRHDFSHQKKDELGTFTHYVDMPSPLLAPVGGEAHAILEFSVVDIPIIKNCVETDCRGLIGDNKSKPKELPIEIGHIQEIDAKDMMYHNGEILLNYGFPSCENIGKVGIIQVQGFGNMEKYLDLAKAAPKEWYT